MNLVFSADGLRALRGSWIVLALAVVAAVAIVAASHWVLERERRGGLNAAKRLQEARGRVDVARRERDSLQESADVFRTLVDRGLLQSENRLDLVEFVNGLRARNQLYALDYEIAPQRPLALPGGRSFPSVEVLASRVKFRARALHEGDLMGFVAGFSESRQGFYPVDQCAMKRIEVAQPDALAPRVEADCSLEWITLKERRAAS